LIDGEGEEANDIDDDETILDEDDSLGLEAGFNNSDTDIGGGSFATNINANELGGLEEGGDYGDELEYEGEGEEEGENYDSDDEPYNNLDSIDLSENGS
jgi:hypothetical protein